MKKKYWVISIVCFICFLATLFFVVKNGVVTNDTTGSIDEENLTKWVNDNK